jgi:hypothetical protein
VNTEDIQYHIKKAGLWPAICDYRVVTITKPGRPDVTGWSRTNLRSTDGFIRQSIGTTVDAAVLGAGAAYWRKVQS